MCGVRALMEHFSYGFYERDRRFIGTSDVAAVYVVLDERDIILFL